MTCFSAVFIYTFGPFNLIVWDCIRELPDGETGKPDAIARRYSG